MVPRQEKLEELLRTLEDNKTNRIIISRERLLPFLFEYACQRIEYDKLEAKTLSSEIGDVMYCKLERMVEKHSAKYYQVKEPQILAVPSIKNIPRIIKQEKMQVAKSKKYE